MEFKPPGSPGPLHFPGLENPADTRKEEKKGERERKKGGRKGGKEKKTLNVVDVYMLSFMRVQTRNRPSQSVKC